MRAFAGILFFAILFPLPFCEAWSQNTRADELARKKSEKASQLAAYKPNKGEEWVVRIQKWGIVSGLPRGFYPYFGSAFPGGGIAVGGGYRTLFANSGIFDFHGAWSFANYRMLQSSLLFPEFAGGKIHTAINAKYQHADKVPFFGVGNDSAQEDEATYLYKPLSVSLTETVRPARWLQFGGGIGYLRLDTGEGVESPSIEQVYTPETAPGLGVSPRYTVGNLFAEIDWRQSPGYTTSGGYYRVDWYDYNQNDGSGFGFYRVDVELNQFVPVLRANQVIALRALASFTDIDAEEQVPYFLLPKLGGGEELRGFRDFRFRDRNRMLITAEYRWTPSKFMDMAVFYEAGKVASRTGDLDFNDLHHCYGIGARFHTPAATAFRVELAHSDEGTRIIFGAGPVF